MFLSKSAVPTQHFRFKEIFTVSSVARHRFLQQKWLITDNYKAHYEWRDVGCVDEKAPDIEPYDENPNLWD